MAEKQTLQEMENYVTYMHLEKKYDEAISLFIYFFLSRNEAYKEINIMKLILKDMKIKGDKLIYAV